MKAILNGLSQIYDFFLMLGEMVRHFFQSIIEMFKMIQSTTYNLGLLTSTLPPWLIGYAIATTSVVVIYLIVGRTAGK